MPAVDRELLITYGSVAIASVAAGTGVYTIVTDEPISWVKVGDQIRCYGFGNAANNGVFTVTAVGATTITTDNSSSAADTTGFVGYVVGGTSDHLLDYYHAVENNYVTTAVRFSFVIQDDDPDNFEAKVQSADRIFRLPRRDLIVDQGTRELLGRRQTTNTGFNSEPRIEKREDLADTKKSRRYTVYIAFEMPADIVEEDGLRTHTVNVEYSPSRRRKVTIDGTWTNVPGGTDSRAQYEANIDAFALSVLTALGIAAASELAEEPMTEHDATNSVLTFTRVYDEIIFSQGGAAVDDSAIVRQSLKIARNRVAPGDTPIANRLVIMSVDYDAWIDKDVTQNLVNKWESIRDWMIQQVQDAFGGGTIAVVDEKPMFDYDDNRISVTMTVLGVPVGGVIEQRVTTELFELAGSTLVPVWSGDPLAKYFYQGPARKVQTVLEVRKVFGLVDSAGAGGAGAAGAAVAAGVGGGFGGFNIGGQSFGFVGTNSGAAQSALVQAALGDGAAAGQQQAEQPGAEQAVLISTRTATTPLRLGLEGHQFDITEIKIETIREFFKPVPGGGRRPVASRAAGAQGV